MASSSAARMPERHRDIAFIDLAAQQRHLRADIDAAIARVLARGDYILGREVGELETELAAFCNAPHCITCANGTDALSLVLSTWNIGPGDAVFVPSFTFVATAEAVALRGATPVFVDVDAETFNIDPDHLAATIVDTKTNSDLAPKAIIGVCLFGLPANYPRLRKLADEHSLKLLADSAQGFGATIDGKHAIEWADAVTTSFFPAKPLGCYGDGGAVFVSDQKTDTELRSIRFHGKGNEKYDNVRIGYNSRLDTIQAAILKVKLAAYPGELAARTRIASRYCELLAGEPLQVPSVPDNMTSSFAQFTLRTDNRDQIAASLKTAGIPTGIYYPKPLHRQGAYQSYPVGPGGNPVADRLSETVLSLPMHPYLTTQDQDVIAEQVRRAARV